MSEYRELQLFGEKGIETRFKWFGTEFAVDIHADQICDCDDHCDCEPYIKSVTLSEEQTKILQDFIADCLRGQG